MADEVLLQEMPDGSLRWLNLAVGDKTLGSGSLQEFADQTQGQTVLLVWPATDALLVELELPLRNPAQIIKALPFALEDHLAEDVERYHLVWRRIPRSARIAVAVVAHEALLACRQRFAEAGVALSMILPEPLLLPWSEVHCTMLLASDRCVFRQGAWIGGGGNLAFAHLVREKCVSSTQSDDDLQLYVADKTVAEETTFSEGQVPVDIVEPLALYAKQWQSAAQLNLLSGDYAVKRQTKAEMRLWWPAVGILMLALSVQMLGQWRVVAQQRQQLAAYEAKNAALFRQTFPDIKRLVNLKVQANQALQDMQKQTQQQSGFLSLLYRVGELLKEQPQLRLHSLQFNDAGLQLRVLGPDSADLEALLNRLSEQTDLQTESQGLSTVKNGMEVEFVVRQN